MKIHEPKSIEEIESTIDFLCDFHDASIRKICFVKERTLEDGDLVYPYVDASEDITIDDDMGYYLNCDVELELLLNCYPTAKKDQVVVVKFLKTKSFTFIQTDRTDYSDIYKFEFEGEKGGELQFCFYATQKMIKVLSLSCEQFICEEL